MAGKGDLPVLFAKAVNSLKKRLVVIGIEGLTDRRVEDLAEKVHYVRLGEVASLPEFLKSSGIKQVVLAGGIPKKEIYRPEFTLDSSAQGFMNRIPNRGDDHLLRAFQVFLKIECGVSVLDSRFFLKELLAKKGVMGGSAPSPSQWKDLGFGFGIAKGIGKMDIGQTVVVKQGIVLAVEALEGTDAAIRRGGELGLTEVVVVKVSKPNQDLRFDLPCIGPETLESLKEAGASAVGVEADKTIMLFKDRLIEEADKAGIVLVGL